MTLARTAAVVYVFWGILHVIAAYKVYMLGETLEAGMVQGRIFQNAWNLLFFALFGTVIAVLFNWRNSKIGYWSNLIVVSAGDIGFILFVLAPGYLPFIPGALGPFLWIVALLFSTLALKREPITA